MPTFLRTVVTIPADSGLPEDQLVNVWHFKTESDPALAGSLAAIANTLGDAYDIPAPFFSSKYAWNTAKATFYNLADPEPRVPMAQLSLAMAVDPAPGAALPAELAICLSYEAVQISGQPQSRRRGRIYTGPFQVSGAVDHASPLDAVLTAVKNMGAKVLTDSDANVDWTWCVYSRTTNLGNGNPPSAPQPLASSFFPVVRGWVDNAWDVQRRRGLAPTSRKTFPGAG